MASKQELETLGIVAKQCKECCRDISEEEFNKYKGYCRNCYSDRHNIENAKKQVNNGTKVNSYYADDDRKINTVAKILRVVAIIEIICGFILGGILGDTFGIGYRGYDYNWGLCIGIIVAGFISGIFILGFAEIIQLLQDIKDKN